MQIMRVGILALLHESNTFINRPTTLDDFRANLLLSGEEIREQLADSHHELGGFFEGLSKCGLQAVPIFAARAVPYGTIAADSFRQLVEIMLSALENAGPLDGLLVAPHGATVSEDYPDADGYWLNEVRERVGFKLPIIGTLDAHANLSQKMVDSCDALISYRSNPHLDQRERGIEAATLLARTLRGEVRPAMAACMPPMAMDIEKQATDESPCRELIELADQQRQDERVLTNSVLLGFPYADVAEMGSATICVTDNDLQLANQLAKQLAEWMWSHRAEFVGQHAGIGEALDNACKMDGPICLLDMGDNVGGGSPADGTFLAHAIHARRLPASFVCLYDPDSVADAMKIGVDSQIRLSVGGKTDKQHGEPLEAEFTLLGLYDGRFEEPEPRHGGMRSMDQGQTAVVRTDHGLTIMLTSRRMPPFSLRQLTTFGVDPSQFHLLVAKGVNAPLAAYRHVCPNFIRVNTPGSTVADMTMLDFHNRRRPMYPFEEDVCWGD